MTYLKASTQCTETWCRQEALEGSFKCQYHLRPVEQDYQGPRRFEFRAACANCGRGNWLKLTAEEAAALKPAVCAEQYCNGRMRLDRDDFGLTGGSADAPVPTRTDTRPGHKAARS